MSSPCSPFRSHPRAVSTPPLGTVRPPLYVARDHSRAEHCPSCPWASAQASPPHERLVVETRAHSLDLALPTYRPPPSAVLGASDAVADREPTVCPPTVASCPRADALTCCPNASLSTVWAVGAVRSHVTRQHPPASELSPPRPAAVPPRRARVRCGWRPCLSRLSRPRPGGRQHAWPAADTAAHAP